MYDTLLLLKPNASFTLEDLHCVVSEVTQSGFATIQRRPTSLLISLRSASLHIAWASGSHVLEESDEMAGRFSVPSQGCLARFEMSGDDPDMELFNDYLLINERLQATGKFIIFDTQECKLLFDEPGEAVRTTDRSSTAVPQKPPVPARIALRNTGIALGAVAVAGFSFARRFLLDVNAYTAAIAIGMCLVVTTCCFAHAYLSFYRSAKVANWVIMPVLIAGVIAGFFWLRHYLGLNE